MKNIWASPGLETVWQVHQNLHNSDVRNTTPEYIANMEANCSAQFLEASVSADGSFQIQAGGSGRPRTYKRK